MEALTISQANLNTIENNMQSVATELRGVIEHITEVNNRINNVESKVSGVNNDINNVVEEIRVNTILNNARQNIIYNNSIIEKKFGYYDSLRRKTESLLDCIKNNNLDKNTLIDLRNNITMNNPRYWLANATLSIIYWLLNNKEDSNLELQKALEKDPEKTSLLMIMLYLELDRKETALHWLNYYLNHQDPTGVKNEFVTVLDLVSSGYLGIEGEKIILEKINTWIGKINTNIKEKVTNKWSQIINNSKKDNTKFNYITDYALNKNVIINNLSIYCAFQEFNNYIDNVVNLEKEEKNLNKIIYNLIYDYEENEKKYQLDNLRNELLIQTNGNKTEAERLYNQEKNIFSQKTDILTLFNNIITDSGKYNVSDNTIKTALIFQKENILKALEENNNKINDTEINFHIDDIYASTRDGKDYNKIKKSIIASADNKYQDSDKSLIAILILINIIGLIAVILVNNNSIVSLITLAIIIIVNFIIIIKLNKKEKNQEEQKKSYINSISNIMEKNFAECTDYYNQIQSEKENYNNLINKINSLKIENVIVLKERKINIIR